MAAILAVIVWHMTAVVRTRRWQDAATYIASRVLLLDFLGGSALVLRWQGVDCHLHHLYLGALPTCIAYQCMPWQAASACVHLPKTPLCC